MALQKVVKKRGEVTVRFRVGNKTRLHLGKRASLEISIQAIVIVVLAMTLLGLGLGFVRNLFEDIGGTTEQVTEQVKQQIKEQLITSDQKISFPVTEMKIDKGDSQVITIGLRNKLDASLVYTMTFQPVDWPGKNDNPAVAAPAEADWFQYKKTGSISPADVEVREVRLSIPSGDLQGSYFWNFEVTDANGNLYASKDVFIVVRG